MKRMLPRNKNGEGLACKNRVMIRLNDGQFDFLNELSEELEMSKTEIFRWLLRKEFKKRCGNFDVDDDLICEEFDVIL